MTTIAEMTEACRKLRLRKAPLNFRPMLIHLVDTAIGYVHPSRMGFHGGQTAWTDSSLWFQCHKDANDFCKTRPSHEKAKVVKLNMCAFQEPVIRSRP